MAVDTKTLEKHLIQVRRIAEHREAGSEVKIRKMFTKLKKELNAFIGSEYVKYAEDDKLDFAILQKNREYARFLEEVISKFDDITPEVQKEVQSLIEDTYKTCYAGMVDGVQKCGKMPELRETFTAIKSISPAHVKAAVKNPVDKLTLKPTLERNRKNIIANIQREIGIGLNNGDRMSTMARRIQKYVDQDYRKSVLIARTEAHRVREVGFNDSAERIDKKLSENDSEYRLVKTWRTMQDGAVRHTNLANHRDMDDVSVLQDGDFELTGGAKAPCPGMSGIAAEDCNCRCYVERELMTDAEYFAKTGKHFKDKAFTNEEKGDIIKAEAASRYVNTSDELYKNAKKIVPIDGYEDITIHGDKHGFEIRALDDRKSEIYTPREFAEILKEDPNYHGGNIRLIACETGAKDAIAAQALATQLNVTVLAPTDIVWVFPDGEMIIGPTQFENTGEWKKFKPKRG